MHAHCPYCQRGYIEPYPLYPHAVTVGGAEAVRSSPDPTDSKPKPNIDLSFPFGDVIARSILPATWQSFGNEKIAHLHLHLHEHAVASAGASDAPTGLPDETGDDVAMTDPRPASPAALQNLTDLIQSLRCGECHPDCMLGIVASLPQQGF